MCCNDVFDGWKRYLERNLGERQEEIDILGVVEDIPRDMSKPPLYPNYNMMVLSTSRGEIVQTVTDEWREAILGGRSTKIVIHIEETIVRAGYDYVKE